MTPLDQPRSQSRIWRKKKPQRKLNSKSKMGTIGRKRGGGGSNWRRRKRRERRKRRRTTMTIRVRRTKIWTPTRWQRRP